MRFAYFNLGGGCGSECAYVYVCVTTTAGRDRVSHEQRANAYECDRHDHLVIAHNQSYDTTPGMYFLFLTLFKTYLSIFHF